MRTASSVLTPGSRRDRSYWLDLLGRVLPALFFGVILAVVAVQVWALLERIGTGRATLTDWLAVVHRLLSLGYFALAVVLFTVRLRARQPERRPLRVAGALVGTFAVMAAPLLPAYPRPAALVLTGDVLLIAGLAWSLYGLAYLRRSFSILPEARRLVTGGPYRVGRHPLYLGEGVASLGVVLPVAGWAHGILIALFLVAQAFRIRWEEEALESSFGAEYRAYRRRTPLLLPWPGRKAGGAGSS